MNYLSIECVSMACRTGVVAAHICLDSKCGRFAFCVCALKCKCTPMPTYRRPAVNRSAITFVFFLCLYLSVSFSFVIVVHCLRVRCAECRRAAVVAIVRCHDMMTIFKEMRVFEIERT